MAIGRGKIGQQIMKPGSTRKLKKTSGRMSGRKNTARSKQRKNRLY